ncbi:transposase [Eubacterium sp.]|uniref:transposase n=1 Tax=Eubacterium sp. TaxID=142586 RepID=UPI00258CAEFF|nr:transposase [Eubacterium sp.]MCR5367692.1 transposase [Eubacterium sp.]
MRNEGRRIGEVKYYILFRTRRNCKYFTDEIYEKAEHVLEEYIESLGYRVEAVQARGHLAYFEVSTNDFSISPAGLVNQIRKSSSQLIKEIPELSHLPNIWQSGFFLKTTPPTKKELQEYIVSED